MRTAKQPANRYPRSSKKAPSKPKAPALPLGLTPAVRRIIVAGTKAGVPWSVVASRAGVPQHNIRKWKARGQELNDLFAKDGKLPDDVSTDDMDCLRFFDELEAAHNTAVELFAKTIFKAGKKNWSAAAWWLERRAPEYFRPKKTEDSASATVTVNKDSTHVALYLPDNGRDPK